MLQLIRLGYLSTDQSQTNADAGVTVSDADKQQKRLANLEKARAAAAAARIAQGEMTRIQKEKIKLEKLAAKEQLANEVKALKQQITAAPAAPAPSAAPGAASGAAPNPKRQRQRLKSHRPHPLNRTTTAATTAV
eukprot:jgi/Chrzof1/2800/UNPLg00714.t1